MATTRRAEIIDGRTEAAKLIERAASATARLSHTPSVLVAAAAGAGPQVELIRGPLTAAGFSVETCLLSDLRKRLRVRADDHTFSGVVGAGPGSGDAVARALERQVDGAIYDLDCQRREAQLHAREGGRPRPAVAEALERLLILNGYRLRGRAVAVVGTGRAGLAIAGSLIAAGSVVEIFDRSDDLVALRAAELVVLAAGIPGLVGPEWLDPEATVIDVGLTTTAAGLRGDADGRVIRHVAAFAPVPHGIAALKGAVLVERAVAVARERLGRRRG